MKKNTIIRILLMAALSLEALMAGKAFSVPQDKRFKDFEIRVIRPKYFAKEVNLSLVGKPQLLQIKPLFILF